MIDPIPSGTRDVLPDEMRELRAITETVRAVFDARGYGEVATPALEYETTLARGDAAAAEPAYRLFDEQGNVLVLRSDMTIPIARVVATRYARSSPPLRFCYFAHAYRSVRPSRGQAREMLQAGIELVGRAGAGGDDRGARAAVRGARRGRARRLPDRARRRVAVPGAAGRGRGARRGARAPLLHELVTRDFVGLEREIEALRLGSAESEALLRTPQLRGDASVLDVGGPAAEVVGRLRTLHEGLTPRAAERVIFDLGLSRSLGYYTGAIFEVYDGAVGVPLGGGGRYDDLLARFGRELPACGLGAERGAAAHRAGGRGGARRAMGLNGLTIAVPRGALMRETLDLLDTLGVETAVVRDNDRRLLFSEVGIVTMRPSDVPTYVEAGAADLGITGKDVLAEQVEREVYELADLGYGRCVMVFATVEGDDPAAEALRRLGVMRIATKYPRIAARYFERTGRQAEIVEVKGSVELAPLTGLVEGIVDLTATGTTLRENGLVVREELWASTARLIANPVAHKLKAAEIDELLARIRDAA